LLATLTAAAAAADDDDGDGMRTKNPLLNPMHSLPPNICKTQQIRTIATDDHVAWCVCLPRACAVQKRRDRTDVLWGKLLLVQPGTNAVAVANNISS